MTDPTFQPGGFTVVSDEPDRVITVKIDDQSTTWTYTPIFGRDGKWTCVPHSPQWKPPSA